MKLELSLRFECQVAVLWACAPPQCLNVHVDCQLVAATYGHLLRALWLLSAPNTAVSSLITPPGLCPLSLAGWLLAGHLTG